MPGPLGALGGNLPERTPVVAFIGPDFGETRAERRERSWFLTPVRTLSQVPLGSAEPGSPLGSKGAGLKLGPDSSWFGQCSRSP